MAGLRFSVEHLLHSDFLNMLLQFNHLRRNGVLGDMGTWSSLACVFVAYARECPICLCMTGLVHKRFPVGPIADVPYFRNVAAAHQLHHTEKFNGVPYGLFLGPREIEEVGGVEELDKEINRRIKLSKGSVRSN